MEGKGKGKDIRGEGIEGREGRLRRKTEGPKKIAKRKLRRIKKNRREKERRQETGIKKEESRRLSYSTVFKYLDVKLEDSLSYSEHVRYVATKVSQKLGLMSRIRHLSANIRVRKPTLQGNDFAAT